MTSTVLYARNMEGHTNRITLATVASTMPMVLLPKGMGVQVGHEETDTLTRTVRTQENVKGQIMLR